MPPWAPSKPAHDASYLEYLFSKLFYILCSRRKKVAGPINAVTYMYMYPYSCMHGHEVANHLVGRVN